MEPGSTRQRRIVGLLAGLALVGLAALVLLPSRDSVTVATPALVLVVPGIVAGLVGGRLAGVLTAAVAALALDVAFIEPYGRPTVHLVDDVVALTAFAAVALTVATLVAQANDRRRAAEQRAQEVLRLSEEKARIERDQHRLSSEKTALEQSEDARRALLRSVSHDLRTPLAAIKAITSDLRAGASYDARTRDELLDVVGDEAERLDRLVANLLSLSRIEAGALEPDLQAVDLAELLDDRVRRLSPVLRDVRVETTLPVGLPLVDADYTLLDQVVTNLLENAARHAPRQSVVRIDAREAGDMMAIAVSDEGDGVPPSQREWIFEPFRSGDVSHSSGIGLAICKAIVEAHGGRIAVADTHPERRPSAPTPARPTWPRGPAGAPPDEAMHASPPPPPPPGAPAGRPGARFTFTLPIHRMSPAAESPSAEAPPIDDNATPQPTPPSPPTTPDYTLAEPSVADAARPPAAPGSGDVTPGHARPSASEATADRSHPTGKPQAAPQGRSTAPGQTLAEPSVADAVRPPAAPGSGDATPRHARPSPSMSTVDGPDHGARATCHPDEGPRRVQAPATAVDGGASLTTATGSAEPARPDIAATAVVGGASLTTATGSAEPDAAATAVVGGASVTTPTGAEPAMPDVSDMAAPVVVGGASLPTAGRATSRSEDEAGDGGLPMAPMPPGGPGERGVVEA